ncbi:membrane dipeptidase [Shivajiella indica]|uniref:Membrane dipeptidase n=1 Tax=Shivajiella indica TaxID=872115 RepID=A0ABW5B3A4_9BACT
MEKLFDAHLHPTLKNHFSDSDNPTSPWDSILYKELTAGFRALSLIKCLIRPFLENTIVSQSSLEQLIKGNYRIVMVALFFPDRDLMKAITSNSAFMDIIEKGKFGKFLNRERFDYLKNTGNGFSVLKEDIDLLQSESGGKGKVNFLQKGDSFTISQEKTLDLVFTIEGLHCLRTDLDEVNQENIFQDIKGNLLSLQQQVFISSINLTHIDNSNNIFSNQAYAMDGLRNSGMDDRFLRPVGKGLTELGKRTVDLLEEREVLTDIKHMSWVARRELYEYRKEKEIHSPIVCTHAGFTGIWFQHATEKFTDYILGTVKNGLQYELKLGKPVFSNAHRVFDQVCFNPSTINLFNEDIIEIYNSDGLIGISLDKRILGYTEVEWRDGFYTNTSESVLYFDEGTERVPRIVDVDFISEEEFNMGGFHAGSQNGKNQRKTVRADLFHDRIKADLSYEYDMQYLHFMANILHAVKVGGLIEGKMGIEKMLTKILCIGSDFDGLIDSIGLASKATKVSNLKKKFQNEFRRLARQAGIDLPGNLTGSFIANRIFYENGRDFVGRRLGS